MDTRCCTKFDPFWNLGLNKFFQVLRETWVSACQRPLCVVKFAIGTKEVDVGKIKDIRKNDILPLAELKDSYHALMGFLVIQSHP